MSVTTLGHMDDKRVGYEGCLARSLLSRGSPEYDGGAAGAAAGLAFSYSLDDKK